MKTRITFSKYLIDGCASINISTKDILRSSFQNYLMEIVEFQKGKKITKEFLKSSLYDPINNIYKLGDFYYIWQDNKHTISLKNTNYSYTFFDNGSLTFNTILFLNALNIENDIQYIELKSKNILSFIYNKIHDLIKKFKESKCEIHLNIGDIFIENLINGKGFLQLEGLYYDKNIELSISWKNFFRYSQQSLDNLILMLPCLNIYFKGKRILITYDENLDIFQFC